MSDSPVKDYYKIMGVPHSASTFQIEQAYEKLAHQWLPERHKGNKQQAQARFHEINEAFQVLYNRNSRSHYDQILKKGYSHDDAQSTFSRFFEDHDFINENERQLYESLNPQKSKTVKNYYGVLGLTKTASLDDIKQAYRQLALKYHPKNNQGDQNAKNKFLEINEAYEILSDEKKKEVHEKLFFSKNDPFRAHTTFEDFFGIKPFEFPAEQEFFEPTIRRKWSRMLDRLMEDEIDFSEIKSGETFKENSVYTRDKDVETRKNTRSRVFIDNGAPSETKIEEYIYPNGERDVIKTVTGGGKVQKINYHLKKGEKTPLELTL